MRRALLLSRHSFHHSIPLAVSTAGSRAIPAASGLRGFGASAGRSTGILPVLLFPDIRADKKFPDFQRDDADGFAEIGIAACEPSIPDGPSPLPLALPNAPRPEGGTAKERQ